MQVGPLDIEDVNMVAGIFQNVIDGDLFFHERRKKDPRNEKWNNYWKMRKA